MKRNSRRAVKDPARRHRDRIERLRRFFHRYGFMLTVSVLGLIAVVLLVLVIRGGRPAKPVQTDEPQTEQALYEQAYLCAITPELPYYDRTLTEQGKVGRGMQVTYSTQDPIRKDGKR